MSSSAISHLPSYSPQPTQFPAQIQQFTKVQWTQAEREWIVKRRNEKKSFPRIADLGQQLGILQPGHYKSTTIKSYYHSLKRKNLIDKDGNLI
jgi:hypothetical protein